MFEPVMIPKTPKDMECEELNKDDKPFVKKLVGKLRKGSKTHVKQADDLEKAMTEDNLLEYDGNYHMNKIAKERGLDLTDPRQRRKRTNNKRDNSLILLKTSTYVGKVLLTKRFKGSKSKDGKGGWVNVVTGGTCASEKVY